MGGEICCANVEFIELPSAGYMVGSMLEKLIPHLSRFQILPCLAMMLGHARAHNVQHWMDL